MKRLQPLLPVLIVLTLAGLAVLVVDSAHEGDWGDAPGSRSRQLIDPAPVLIGHPAETPGPAAAPQRSVPPVERASSTLRVGVEWPGADVLGRTATVRVYFQGREPLKGDTDTEGWAVFHDVPPGDAVLWAIAEFPLYGLGGVHVEAGEAAEAVIPLDRGVTIEGHVLDAETGAPVPGAAVFVFLEHPGDGYAAVASSRTDDSGRYETWWVRRSCKGIYEDYTVAATATGYVLGLTSFPPQATAGATRVSLDFRLLHGGAARGTVKRPDGSPAAGARVCLFPQSGAWVQGDPWCDAGHSARRDRLLSARADESGAYEVLGLPLDEVYAVIAEAPGFARSTEVQDLAPTGASPHVHADLTLKEAATLHLRVCTEDGEVLDHVHIRLGLWPEGYQPHNGEEIHVFENLADGRYTLDVKADGWRDYHAEIDLPPGVVTTHEVRLPRGVAVEGVLVDADGEPLAGARVHAFAIDGRSGSSAETDEQGGFSLGGLEPGPHVLGACLADGGELACRRTKVLAPAVGVRLAVLPRGTIRLQVLSPAVPPYFMSVRYEVDGRTYLDSASRSRRDGTDSYLFDVTAGRREFLFHSLGVAPFLQTITVPEGGICDRQAVLEQGIALRGRVVDRHGRSIAGAWLRVNDYERHAETNEEGVFALANLAAERIHIVVGALGFPKKTVNCDLRGDGQHEPLLVTLHKGGLIHGRVLDARGKAVLAQRVWAARTTDTEDGPLEEEEITNEVGAFRMGVSPGHYEVGVLRDAIRVPLGEVEVEDESRAEIDLRLPAG